MAQFGNIILTGVGKELINKVRTANDTLIFTKAVANDTRYTDAEIETLPTMLFKQRAQFTSIDNTVANTIKLDVLFNPDALKEGYYLRSYGIYGRTADSSEETLIAVTSIKEGGEASWVAPNGSKMILNLQMKFILLISNIKTSIPTTVEEEYVKTDIYYNRVNEVNSKFENLNNTIDSSAKEITDYLTDIKNKLDSSIDNKNLNGKCVYKYNVLEFNDFDRTVYGVDNTPSGEIAAESTIEVLRDYRNDIYYESQKLVEYRGCIFIINYEAGAIYMMSCPSGHSDSSIQKHNFNATYGVYSPPSGKTLVNYTNLSYSEKAKIRGLLNSINNNLSFINGFDYNSSKLLPVINKTKLFETLVSKNNIDLNNSETLYNKNIYNVLYYNNNLIVPNMYYNGTKLNGYKNIIGLSSFDFNTYNPLIFGDYINPYNEVSNNISFWKAYNESDLTFDYNNNLGIVLTFHTNHDTYPIALSFMFYKTNNKKLSTAADDYIFKIDPTSSLNNAYFANMNKDEYKNYYSNIAQRLISGELSFTKVNMFASSLLYAYGKHLNEINDDPIRWDGK